MMGWLAVERSEPPGFSDSCKRFAPNLIGGRVDSLREAKQAAVE
jgi:hypothetical protein